MKDGGMDFLDIVESPNCSYVWRSVMAARPILKCRCCWRVEDGSFIRFHSNKWFPNHTTNKVLYLTNEEDVKWLVSDLIDLDLHWWRCEFLISRFWKEDAKTVCHIRLSHRHVSDSIIWFHDKNGMYLVKSGYHVAR